MSVLPHVPFRRFGDSTWGRVFAVDEKPSLAEVHIGVSMRVAESLERIEKLLAKGPPLDPQATQKLFADGVWPAVRELESNNTPPDNWHPSAWQGFMRRLKAEVGWALAEQWWSGGMTVMPDRDDVRRRMKNLPATLSSLPPAAKARIAKGAAYYALTNHGPAWARDALI